MPPQHTHCSYCGSTFSNEQWPRQCDSCKQFTYRNPIPVAVAIVPVDNGLLTIRRGIPPQQGKYALPGGFVDFGETWQEACAREVFEETGITLPHQEIEIFHAESPPDGRTVLLFGLTSPLKKKDLPPFSPTNETTERIVINKPRKLAFPLHTLVAEQYFNNKQ